VVVAPGSGMGGGGGGHAIIAGAADGCLRAWALDGAGGLVAAASTPRIAHPGGVQALATPTTAASSGGTASTASHTLFASAGSDGTVAVWDGRASPAGGPTARLGGGDGSTTTASSSSSSSSSSSGSISSSAGPAWAVALHAGDVGCRGTIPLLAMAGHASGLVRLWCLRAGRPRWAGRLPGRPGVCGVAVGPCATSTGSEPATVFAAAMGGLVTAFEAGTHHPAAGMAATAARLVGAGDAARPAPPPPTVWTALPLPSGGARGSLVGCACGDGRVRLLRHARAAGSARAPAPSDGRPAGVPGVITPLASARVGDQALTCLAWCDGYAGLFATGGMDEAVRVGVVPKAGLV